MADWCTIDADTIKLYFNAEDTAGTHKTAGASQMHPLSGSWTRGHTPNERSPHPGGRQYIALDGVLPGPRLPAVSVTMPLRYEDTETLLYYCLGGASNMGAWSIGSALPSVSIGIRDGAIWRKFSGMQVARFSISTSPGAQAEITMEFEGLLYEEGVLSGGSGYDDLGLTTAPTNRAYIWDDLGVSGGTANTVGTELWPESVTISGDNQLQNKAKPGTFYPGCITAGTLKITGTLAFPFSTNFQTNMEAYAESFALHFIQLTWTVNAKTLTLLCPGKLVVANHSAPEGSTPQTSDLNFLGVAEDFSLTTDTIKATSTTF